MRPARFTCRHLLISAAFGLSIAIVPPLEAGRNADGTLILHVHTGLVPCTEPGSWCREIGAGDPLEDCLSATTNDASGSPALLSVYAAFPPSTSPRVAGVAFGLDYDPNEIDIIGTAPCSEFEYPTGGWPAPGEGVALTWARAQTDQLVHIYVFSASNAYGNDQRLDLIPHPTLGAIFVDDEAPVAQDPIRDLGSFGFGSLEGFGPCPENNPTGACCYSGCRCEVLKKFECENEGGIHVGTDTTCDPNPCDCPIFGACCSSPYDCFESTRSECFDLGYWFMGEVPCSPFPCYPPLVRESSWGEIKAIHRPNGR